MSTPSIHPHMFSAILAVLSFFSSLLSPFVSPVFAETMITNPRVNDRIEPVGVESVRFSWNLQDKENGTFQAEYKILVGEQKEITSKTAIWDSGWQKSAKTLGIRYTGETLKPSRKYYWNVNVKNNRGEISTLKNAVPFTTGVTILDNTQFADNKTDNWKAKWISVDRTDKDPLPIFRKSFKVDPSKKIEHAVVHVCGLGHYELNLNGEKVGKNIGTNPNGEIFIDPGWTNYRKTCLYSSFDLTDQLTPGENVVGVMLGNGMYNVPGGRYVKFTGSFGLPKMICKLQIRYTDGSTEEIESDETWKAALGPITFSCVYGGEDVDYRRNQPGWDKPGFDESAAYTQTGDATLKWSNAKIVDGPGGTLRAQEAPPVIVAKKMTPEAVKCLSDGKYVADFGYNFSGRPRVVLKGKPGQIATVKTAEIADRIWEGHSYTVTLSGGEDELILPKFTYFGFQFLYVEGAVRDEDRTEADTEKPTLVSFDADFTTSSAESVGYFACSSEMLNEVDAMIDRSVRSNMQSVLTDCPHREKLGWLEVSHLMGPSIMYRYNVHNMYRKICRDMRESQLENGLVPDIAPEYTRFVDGFFESPEWGSAVVQIPSQLQTIYCDDEIVGEQYDAMKKYVEYLDSTRKQNDKGLVKPGLGDWYDWSPERSHAGYSQHTPRELNATAIFIDDVNKLRQMSESGNYPESVCQYYNAMSKDAENAYMNAYYDPDKKTFATGSQAALAESFWVVTDSESKNGIIEKLVERIEADEYKPTIGEVSHVRLLRALSSTNRDDIIWKMINRTDKPGYGYMLKECGMKTLSETWDGPGSSMNHCMFGHAQEWFTEVILGIKKIEGNTFFLKPTPLETLTWAKGFYDSVYGRVESEWKVENGKFKFRCVIPTNTKAVLLLPNMNSETVSVNGKKCCLEKIKLMDNEYFLLDNGTYEIETDLVKQ
ncbi:MAG: family 78 glycoside hydrolase catalytic domain [Thermoguttaceae bacterium]